MKYIQIMADHPVPTNLEREILANQNVHKMNAFLAQQIEEYAQCFFTLKNYLLQAKGEDKMDQSDTVTTEQAAIITQQIGEVILRNSHCQCERWKKLYQHESQQSQRLGQLNESLIERMQERDQEQLLDQVQIQKLFEDYMTLYSKSLSSFGASDAPVKQARSNSKNKSKSKAENSTKKIDAFTKQRKIQMESAKWKEQFERLSQKVQKKTAQLQGQRIKILEKQWIIRAYRQKERQRLVGESNDDF